MSEQGANEESMETSSVVPEGVRELLEQRSTYRRWLERLDEVGEEYRPAVAERVRSDYEDRLAGVAQELEGHRHELESSTERRRERLDELSNAFEARSAELEEAELRFQVGEFDDDAWEEKRTELTEGLEDIEAELSEARGAVDELEEILAELGEDAGATPARTAGGQRSAVASSKARPPLQALDGGLAEESAATAPPDTSVAESMQTEAKEESEAEDEIESASESGPASTDGDGNESVGEESVTVAASAPAEAESASEESAEGEADEYRDELEFLESLSLDDPDSFDAVSRMLEDEEDR